MKHIIILIIAFSLTLSAGEEPLPQSSLSIIAKLNKDILEIQKKAIVQLEKDLKEVVKKGNLDSAIAVKGEIARIQGLVDAVNEDAMVKAGILPDGILAILYSGSDYSGAKMDLVKIGKYGIPSVGNDSVRSVKVRKGYSVVLWQHELGSGNMWKIEKDTKDLPPDASSFEVSIIK